MIRFASLVLLIGHFYFCSVALGQDDNAYKFDFSYTYGTLQLLPGLVANAGHDFDEDKNYSDIWIHGDINISDKLSYAGSAEITDQPHQLINTKYSRPDYPLSTGRIQRSAFKYSHNDFSLIVGRDDMLGSHLRPQIFIYPTYGDGFSWSYKTHGWGAKHVFQVLPAEKGNGQVFRRSISYHHLAKDFHNFTLGVGEYFILTGENIEFDLKRLNPFLPYALNSHDSEADNFPGYVGDTDNSLIKLFIDWRKKSSQLSLSLYVDEFQIDAADRAIKNDALLLNLSVFNDLEVFGVNSRIIWGFSVGNTNFGQHPGPFTTTTIGMYPLFEYTPGMKDLVFIESNTSLGKTWQFTIAGYSERWVNISELLPSQMNQRADLEELKIHSDSRLLFGVEYRLEQYPIRFKVSGWSGNSPGMCLKTQLGF